MSRRLRVGVIGCGKVAQNLHLPALAKSARCELVAVCDSSPIVAEEVARRYRIERIYDDVGRALQDEATEAVIVSVGDPLHVTVAERALAAGKHVLVEKPLGVSAAECRPLRDAVAHSGRVLQVGTMKRSDPGVAYAREAIADMGDLRSFGIWYRAGADAFVDESTVFLPVIRDPAYERSAYKLERQAYYLAGHGAHLFDSLRYLVGEPASVEAELAEGGGQYSWHGLVRLERGGIGHFDLLVYVASEWAEGLDVYAERGSVHLTTPNPFFLRPSQVRVFDAGRREWHEPLFEEGDAYLRQLEAFAASALDGAPVVAGLEDGIAALELIEAVAQSVAAGGVKVPVTHA